jgi:putative PIN family toxin of toxin-antitoxin system
MADTVVYDCMIFLQAAARQESPAAACLRAAESGQVRLAISADIVGEIADVLQRPKIVARFPALTAERVAAFLQALMSLAEVQQSVPALIKFRRDPKDAKYLDLAVATSARYLVSRDRDLLDLHTDGSPDAAEVFRHCPGLQILTPEDFLHTLDQATNSASSKTKSDGS